MATPPQQFAPVPSRQAAQSTRRPVSCGEGSQRAGGSVRAYSFIAILVCPGVAKFVAACSRGAPPAEEPLSGGSATPATEATPLPPQPNTPNPAPPRATSPTPAAPASLAAESPATQEPGTQENEPNDDIAWDDLQSLAFHIEGEALQLDNGLAEGPSYGRESRDRYTLQNHWAIGDLDSDGRNDAVMHLVLWTGGSGVFHYLVPVLDDGGTLVARQEVFLGDRIVVEEIAVVDGLIHVSMLDRGLKDPFVVLTERRTLSIDISASPPLAATVRVEPLDDAPGPAP